MNKSYRIYVTENKFDCIDVVDSIDRVLEIVKMLDTEYFMIVEHDKEKRCDNGITYEIKEMLKENDNVSRRTQKVYKRKKL